MPRKLKPYKVDTVHHKLANVHIFFDREDKKFFARLGAERVEAADVDTCKRLTAEMIPRASVLTWKPMIEVEGGVDEVQRHRCECVRIELSYERFELAERIDMGLVQREHTEDNGDEGRRIEPYVAYPDMRTLLPYTEATWAALDRLRRSIEEAGLRLEEIRKSPERLAAALAGGQGLLMCLPPPKTKRK